MSGGIGPTGDITLPNDDDHNHNHPEPAGKPLPLFTFRQLNCLAVAVVLSASGMVSPENLAFVLFFLIYIHFIAKFAFPAASARPDPPVFGETNRLLSLYVAVAAVIGLFLPIAYIFEGVFEGDKAGIKAAAPHVFLLASQVFMEGLTFSSRFSLPIRVFVPVFYNSRRIFTIVDWLRSEIWKAEEGTLRSRRLYVGRGLAIANMAFWSFNLFGFLLPVYLPRAFRIYYQSSHNKIN